ncbi:MAG TPA: universal stress protein [Solirubrobacteraceae bacterium]|jgi:nucleotide-binding universal stress UspA family protein
MPDSSGGTTAGAPGPVLFAYDGSELAKLAISVAGRELGQGREAIVLTVWQPFNVGFIPPGEMNVDAADAEEVSRAAEATASEGAALAQAAGFHASTASLRGAPAWQGIVDAADQHGASVIALGSRGRSGVASVLIGSVAEAVAAHSKRSVLIVHDGG